jgi:hypothetical protein
MVYNHFGLIIKFAFKPYEWGIALKKLTVNSSFYVINDRASAVLSTLCTIIYLSFAIYLGLLDRMGRDRTMATLCRMFPSRELTTVFVLLVSLAFMGIVAMLCYNFDMLPIILTTDALVKIAASGFFIYYTGSAVFCIALATCVLYFISSALRIFAEPQKSSYSLLEEL